MDSRCRPSTAPVKEDGPQPELSQSGPPQTIGIRMRSTYDDPVLTQARNLIVNKQQPN